ncbi:YhcN/YlaJ family sporulation lipoprotein [Bacillus cihuensis]|uniref:YhcN/YlaJ family sporulation lipoprotein n=1 Tax=Bacillus cihuensis TaxID=1208599 RepID=UPI00041C5A8B|nr:YhcN/YlaJ family sporulation lipoprotein [Bacillus cihuensis]
MKNAIIAGGIIATLFVGGCTANNANQGTKKQGVDNPTNVSYNPNMNPNRNYDGNYDGNYNVNYNENNGNYNRNYNVRNNTNNNNIREGNDLAMEVNKLREVNSSSVMVMGNSAYVAAELSDKGSNELARNVEEKIADKVRAADPSIENVYVSSNPDFIDRMQGYSNDVRNGHPISGFANEFTETVKRVFPSAH